MQLTSFTDYALRTLMYLAVHRPSEVEGDAWVPTASVADAYGVSLHHLSKVSQALAAEGWIETRRGRTGGMRLAQSAEQISVGAVVRALEPAALVECFDPDTPEPCALTPACGLRGALREAQELFLSSLDGVTLADCVGKRTSRLLRLLKP